jgi:hypothetical protein
LEIPYSKLDRKGKKALLKRGKNGWRMNIKSECFLREWSSYFTGIMK